MNGPALRQRSLLARAGGAVDRCLATLQTAAFWLAVGLPAAYLLAYLHPVSPLTTVEGLSAALGLHAVALIVGHRSHRDANGGDA